MDKYLHCRLTISAKAGSHYLRHEAFERIQQVLDEARAKIKEYGYDTHVTFTDNDDADWPSDPETITTEAERRLRTSEIIAQLKHGKCVTKSK